MYCGVKISAPSEEEADEIARRLVEKRLASGTRITSGKSHYRWKGEIVEKEYWNIEAYSLKKKKEEIIEEVEKIHSDECPVITFSEIDGNKDFLEWIEENIK